MASPEWRDASHPDLVSTPDAHRVCAPNVDTGRAYCGRKNRHTAAWTDVTCTDCWAGRRADDNAITP